MRIGLNQATFEAVDTPAFLEAAAGAGVTCVGLWRHKLAPWGARGVARLTREAGVEVTSLCRGGFFTAPSLRERRRAVRDTCAAVEEAAELGCRTLVLVCGPAHDGDLAGARAASARALAEVVPMAAEHGLTLAVEPFHPVFAADRSAVVTLDQACDLAEAYEPASVGVAVDTFHVWWDPRLEPALARAAGRIATLQVADWPARMGVPLRGRALPGDGVAPLGRIVALVRAAGYAGPAEVEVLAEDVWARPAAEVARTARERMERIVALSERSVLRCAAPRTPTSSSGPAPPAASSPTG
jgi:sugar phosphate isomerase/epimerase